MKKIIILLFVLSISKVGLTQNCFYIGKNLIQIVCLEQYESLYSTKEKEGVIVVSKINKDSTEEMVIFNEKKQKRSVYYFEKDKECCYRFTVVYYNICKNEMWKILKEDYMRETETNKWTIYFHNKAVDFKIKEYYKENLFFIEATEIKEIKEIEELTNKI